MKEVDLLTTERYGVPSLTLMENAGKSVAEFIAKRFPDYVGRRISVLCGKGNNGGDGFVVARHLQEMGARPEVLLFAAPEDLRGDAASNRKRWQDGSGALYIVRNSADWKSSSTPVANAEIIVDALLGTGVRGPVEGLLAEVIRQVNARGPDQRVVAVDIPSGLPADTGEILGPVVEANYTVTSTAPKVGMFQAKASDFVGELSVRHIGAGPSRANSANLQYPGKRTAIRATTATR
jgi:NAD(P)H-hydrate epimerase